MRIDESIEIYEKTINKRIDKAKIDFAYVYHVMHPFEVNKEGKNGIYNEKLEEQLFVNRLLNLILEHFGTLEGFSDDLTVSDDFYEKIILGGSFTISDIQKWFTIKRNGEALIDKEHSDFLNDLYQVVYLYFKKEENWDHYLEDYDGDDEIWNWEELSWESLCRKFKIPFDSSIRFSRIWSWINENGHPTNIRFPREWIDAKAKERILEIANKSSAKISILSNHDSYVTIIGCSQEIKNELKNLGLEFTKE